MCLLYLLCYNYPNCLHFKGMCLDFTMLERSSAVEKQKLESLDQAEGTSPERFPFEPAELAKSYSRRTCWGWLAVASLILTLLMLLAIIFQSDELVANYSAWLKWVQLVFLLVVLFSVLAVHKWSVLAISRLYLKVREDLRAVKAHKSKSRRLDLLGNEPCYYCGYKIAPIVCSKCGSIQWPSLVHQATGIKDTESWWPTAAFIAHHRFKLLAATMSAILVVFLPMMLNMQAKIRLEEQRMQEERAHVTEHLNASLGAVTDFRSSLLVYESSCPPDLISSDLCQEKWERIVTEYFRFSWYGPQTIKFIAKNYCIEGQNYNPENQAIPGSGLDELHNTGCFMLSEFDLVDDLDDQFGRLVETTIASRRGDQRVIASYNLYYSGMRLACALLFAQYPFSTLHNDEEIENTDPKSMQGCQGALIEAQPKQGKWLVEVKNRDELTRFWKTFYDSRMDGNPAP